MRSINVKSKQLNLVKQIKKNPLLNSIKNFNDFPLAFSTLLFQEYSVTCERLLKAEHYNFEIIHFVVFLFASVYETLQITSTS